MTRMERRLLRRKIALRRACLTCALAVLAASIAEELGVSPGTVYKDLHRGDTGETDKNWRNEYDPVLADKVFRRTMSERGRKNASSGVAYPRAIRRDC